MNFHKSKPSLWRQELKNSVRLFRLEPVCMIITFSVRQRRHILEEGVKGCALVRIFHLMEWSTPAPQQFGVVPGDDATQIGHSAV